MEILVRAAGRPGGRWGKLPTLLSVFLTAPLTGCMLHEAGVAPPAPTLPPVVSPSATVASNPSSPEVAPAVPPAATLPIDVSSSVAPSRNDMARQQLAQSMARGPALPIEVASSILTDSPDSAPDETIQMASTRPTPPARTVKATAVKAQPPRQASRAFGSDSAPASSPSADPLVTRTARDSAAAPVAEDATDTEPAATEAVEPEPAPTEAVEPQRPAAEGNAAEAKSEGTAKERDELIAESLEQLGPTPRAVPQPQAEYEIDLAASLRLAQAENPTIAEARTRVLAALAQRQAALALLLPSLNAGANYHGHVGNLQRSAGRILNLSEQSLYFGGGTRTLAAESLAIPAVNITSPLTEAIFEPLAALQGLNRARYENTATFNETLLEVAQLYLDLFAAQAVLDAQRLSEEQTREIVRTVASFAAAGQGRVADAERARTEWKLRQAEVQKAEEELAVASARLARRLNLDPSTQLRPMLAPVTPITLIDAGQPTEDLLAVALRGRPELGARAAGIGEAEARYREEKARPLLPVVWMGFSGGGFGGGANLVPPLMGNFGGRTDFDVRAFWTLMNFGYGNLAKQKQRRAEIGAAVAEQSREINRVRREVAQAQAEALAQANQIEVARRELQISEAGFAEDLERTRGGEGRPIEVLNSLNLLAAARVNLIRAIILSNQAQFRLFVSLGSPPPAPPGPTANPAGPPPVTVPLHSPVVSRP